jgi:hypothetical protein
MNQRANGYLGSGPEMWDNWNSLLSSSSSFVCLAIYGPFLALQCIVHFVMCRFDSFFIWDDETNYSRFIICRLESKNLHEVREAYDITSLDSFFPDKHHPEFRKTITQLVPKLCKLSHRLLRCLAIALGSLYRLNMLESKSYN